MNKGHFILCLTLNLQSHTKRQGIQKFLHRSDTLFSSAMQMTVTELPPAHLYSFSQYLLSIITPSHHSPIFLAEIKIPGHTGMKAPDKSGTELNVQRHQEKVKALPRDKRRCAPFPGVCSCLDSWNHQWESPRGREDSARLTEWHSEEKPLQLQFFPNHSSLTWHKAQHLVCSIQSSRRHEVKNLFAGSVWRKHLLLLDLEGSSRLDPELWWCVEMVVRDWGCNTALRQPSLQCTELVEWRGLKKSPVKCRKDFPVQTVNIWMFTHLASFRGIFYRVIPSWYKTPIKFQITPDILSQKGQNFMLSSAFFSETATLG